MSANDDDDDDDDDGGGGGGGDVDDDKDDDDDDDDEDYDEADKMEVKANGGLNSHVCLRCESLCPSSSSCKTEEMSTYLSDYCINEKHHCCFNLITIILHKYYGVIN